MLRPCLGHCRTRRCLVASLEMGKWAGGVHVDTQCGAVLPQSCRGKVGRWCARGHTVWSGLAAVLPHAECLTDFKA